MCVRNECRSTEPPLETTCLKDKATAIIRLTKDSSKAHKLDFFLIKSKNGNISPIIQPEDINLEKV